MDKALILNLDGTLIKTKSGREVPLHSEDWIVEDRMIKLIEYYSKEKYTIVVVSNQPQIKQGLYSKQRFLEKIGKILRLVERTAKLKCLIPYQFCSSDTSYDFMPKPGMIYELAIDGELDLSKSIMIGCLPIHELAAKNAGVGLYYDVLDFNYNLI